MTRLQLLHLENWIGMWSALLLRAISHASAYLFVAIGFFLLALVVGELERRTS